MNTIKYWFNRIKYFISHGKDDYGKSGFTQLFYKGIPIIRRDDCPTDTLYLLNDDIKIKPLKWSKIIKENKRRFAKIVNIK